MSNKIVIGLVSLIFAVSRVSISYGAEPEKVRVGILLAGEFSSTYIAQKKGFFQKNGLDVDLVYFQGGSQVIQAMLAGDLPLTVTAGPEGVVAKLQGADILLLSTNNPTLAFTFFVPPGITKPEQLRGQKVGISRFGSSSDHSVRFMLQKLGLSENDAAIVAIGDNPTRLAALKSNAIQASLFTVPFAVLVKKSGFIPMLEGYKMGLKFHGSGIATTGAFMHDHRTTVEKFFKGFLEGLHYAKSHKDDSVRLIKEFLHLKQMDEAEETYRVFVQEIYPKKPYPSKEGVETVLRIVEKTLPAAKTVKAEQLIDDSIMKQIDASGFIDRLYQ